VSTQALFYEQVVPVSQASHADLCVDRDVGFEFSRRTNFVPLAGVEFEKAAWHYPIVFIQQDNQFLPAAILGYGAQDNLFLDDAGGWGCDYVPGYVRRYPFILANITEADTFTLCIDPSYAGCTEDGNGDRLFLLGGARSPFLERALAFVQQFHGELKVTSQWCASLAEMDLFEPMQAQVAMNSGEKLSLSGFHTISRERLAAVEPAKIDALLKAGGLELVYLHLFSLANFGSLMGRHSARFGEKPDD
jgi:hypothetical protein